MAVSLFSPAKINLYLAVTGRRADGYHDLVSVVVTLDFGDDLEVVVRPVAAGQPRFTLACSDDAVPVDESNLVLKAARAFAGATGWTGGADFRLTKRIPVGAGLGGGSSNAVAALRALEQATGLALPAAERAGIAASLGSDCPLFLADGPVVMRGRGERVEELEESGAARLRGRRVLLCRPGFAISTPWAFARFVALAPRGYLEASTAEARIAEWRRGTAPGSALLFNNMEAVAFEKFTALPVLRDLLGREFGVALHLSGSGSACFVWWDDDPADAALVARIIRRIRDCWGENVRVTEARVRAG